jgi:hypothetical protein
MKDTLKLAKFHNATVFATSVTTSGSKKIAKKGIPDSDKQKVESLGNDDQVYSVTGFIAARYTIDVVAGKGTLTDNPTYFEMRDALVVAFRGGFALFVNPFGDDEVNAICTEWTFTESETSLGLTPVSFTLETSSIDSIVTVATSSTEEVETAAKKADEEANKNTAAGVKTKFSASFTKAVADASEAINKVKTSVGPLEAKLDELDSYQENITSLLNDVNGLISAPQNLADGLTNAMQGIADLQDDLTKTFSALKSMFDFGDFDIFSPFKTAQSIESKKNRDVIVNQVRVSALANAYLTSSKIDYNTVAEINENNAILDAQFDKVEKTDLLIELRYASQLVFDDGRIKANRTADVEAAPTSARLLAYMYYGSSELGDKIANLNGFKHADDISGTIEIFSA